MMNFPTRSGRRAVRQLRRFTSSSPAQNLVSLRLYRILLRSVNDLLSSSKSNDNRDSPLLLQPKMDADHQGRAREFNVDSNMTLSTWFRAIGSQQFASTAASRLDNDNDSDDDERAWFHLDTDSSAWVTPTEIQSLIRSRFRHYGSETGKEKASLNELQKEAIDALRCIHYQSQLAQTTSTSIEQGIRITATSFYVGEEPIYPMGGKQYRFTYRIRVENVISTDPSEGQHQQQDIQLLGRTWIIRQEGQDEPVATVDSPRTGAVGYQPVLKPGQVFEYMSGCFLPKATGEMKGLLHFAFVPSGTKSARVGDVVEALEDHYDQSKLFSVPVARFPLKSTSKSN